MEEREKDKLKFAAKKREFARREERGMQKDQQPKDDRSRVGKQTEAKNCFDRL